MLGLNNAGLTLGQLIAALGALPPHQPLEFGLGVPDSYRGYYEDVAFEPADAQTASEALAVAKTALGQEFQGYKGGRYLMTGDADVWIASYGKADGRPIVLAGHPAIVPVP